MRRMKIERSEASSVKRLRKQQKENEKYWVKI